MSDRLTLVEALRSDRLADFIDQVEADGVGPVSQIEFDLAAEDVITQRRLEDRTSRSAFRDGLRGK